MDDSVALSVTLSPGSASEPGSAAPVSRITFRHPAPEGTRFGPNAFASSIDQRCEVGTGHGILREAVVIEEGAFALVTVETPAAGKLFGDALIASIPRD